ncbi:MAG: glycosyltransferase family 4 protein [Alphaproteobacteria bacterium]|nr:glycosyltransferase family 4 protein [Alphaproteobacteria bacterium]
MSLNEVKEPVVLQVLPEMEHGGVEVGTVEIAAGCQEKGIKNFVASSGGRMVYDLQKIKVQHFELPLKTKNIFKMRANTKKLAKIIKENGINIVHARSRAPAWSAYWAAKKTGATFLTTYHGTYGLGFLKLKKLYNRVMTYGKLVIAISEHIKKHIMSEYKVPEEKIRLIHRCVNLDNFSPEKVSQERMIKVISDYNIPEDKPVISLIGRITPWKGQALLLEALSKMHNKDYCCLIVGSDQGRTSYSNKLKDMVKKHGLDDRVQFIEHSFDIPALLMISDIVLSIAIEPEAFGRAAIEGQAMGKIVIASNIGGSLENTIDGVTGKLFKSGDADDLASTIDWALDLPNQEKAKISAAAIQNVKEHFTKQIMCDKTIAVYRELMKQ